MQAQRGHRLLRQLGHPAGGQKGRALSKSTPGGTGEGRTDLGADSAKEQQGPPSSLCTEEGSPRHVLRVEFNLLGAVLCKRLSAGTPLFSCLKLLQTWGQVPLAWNGH